MSSKTFKASVEKLEKSDVVLDVRGREVRLPRVVLPATITEGVGITFSVVVDDTEAERADAAFHLDEGVTRRGASRKRGNPRGATARVSKKR